jgi:Pyridoxamine 5'-phosphate oxidase
MNVMPENRDLLNGEFATMATVGPDGRPQLSEVWFLAEGDTVAISLNTSRQKTKNVRANPAANVFLLDLAAPTVTWSSAAMPRSRRMTTTPSRTSSAPSTRPTCAPATRPASRGSR